MKNTLLIINDPLNLIHLISEKFFDFVIISPQNIRNWLTQKLQIQRFISDPITSICFSDEFPHPTTEECGNQFCFLCNSKQLTNQGIEILGILQPHHQINLHFPPQARKMQILRLTPQGDHYQEIDLLFQVIMRILALKIEDKERKLFLSYSKEDTEQFTDDLYKALTRIGFNSFLDKRDLKIGDLWQSELEKRLSNINLLLYIESKNSFKSQWINIEIENAKALGIPIFIIQKGSKGIKERNVHVESTSPNYIVESDENVHTIIAKIKDELLNLISQRLFQLRRTLSGLFELPHRNCLELSISKPKIKDHYLYFIREEENGKGIQSERIISKWIHSVIYPEDVELFKNRISHFKQCLPQFKCKALLYSDLPDYKTEHGKGFRHQIFALANNYEINLYQINEVDNLSCKKMIDQTELLNLPSFQNLLKDKRIFLSGSFGQIISGVPSNLDHNMASFLLREVVQLILTNEGKLIFG
ncbi:MAG: toll/interleukin-1 receptor domain-containing protein, partial [Candidatus Hodarchaeota archaeon]